MTMLQHDPTAKYQMVRLPLMVFRRTDKWPGGGPPDVLRQYGSVVMGLLEAGTLRAAGPFIDAQGRPGFVPGVVGLFVFAAMPLDAAKAIAEKDPLVREGYARIDAMEWFVADEAVPKAPNAGSASPR